MLEPHYAMRLLTEIIDQLSSDKPNVEIALSKAQVLAHRLGDPELRTWVEHELRGYADRDALPKYRVLPVTVMANVSNGVMRYADHPLPMFAIDERVRRRLEFTHLVESIAVIEAWSKSERELAIVVAPEFHGELSKGLDRSFQIERAWGKHSVGAMLQVVVEVKARLLDFALQLSDRIPQDPTTDSIRQVSKEVAVSEIFRNAVFGSNTTIVVGTGTIQNVSNSVVINDLESLLNALRGQGVEEADIVELRDAISTDSTSEEVNTRKLGPAVKGWIAKMVGKAASGAWEISLAAAGGLLAAAVGAYYGISGV